MFTNNLKFTYKMSNGSANVYQQSQVDLKANRQRLQGIVARRGSCFASASNLVSVNWSSVESCLAIARAVAVSFGVQREYSPIKSKSFLVQQ